MTHKMKIYVGFGIIVHHVNKGMSKFAIILLVTPYKQYTWIIWC